MGQRADRGAADAGHVEPDDLDAGIEGIDERLQHLELVPMPPHMSHGVPVPSPARTSTRSRRRPTARWRVAGVGFIRPGPRTVRFGPVDPIPTTGARRREMDRVRAVIRRPRRVLLGHRPSDEPCRVDVLALTISGAGERVQPPPGGLPCDLPSYLSTISAAAAGSPILETSTRSRAQWPTRAPRFNPAIELELVGCTEIDQNLPTYRDR